MRRGRAVSRNVNFFTTYIPPKAKLRKLLFIDFSSVDLYTSDTEYITKTNDCCWVVEMITCALGTPELNSLFDRLHTAVTLVCSIFNI